MVGRSGGRNEVDGIVEAGMATGSIQSQPTDFLFENLGSGGGFYSGVS